MILKINHAGCKHAAARLCQKEKREPRHLTGKQRRDWRTSSCVFDLMSFNAKQGADELFSESTQVVRKFIYIRLYLSKADITPSLKSNKQRSSVTLKQRKKVTSIWPKASVEFCLKCKLNVFNV